MTEPSERSTELAAQPVVLRHQDVGRVLPAHVGVCQTRHVVSTRGPVGQVDDHEAVGLGERELRVPSLAQAGRPDDRVRLRAAVVGARDEAVDVHAAPAAVVAEHVDQRVVQLVVDCERRVGDGVGRQCGSVVARRGCVDGQGRPVRIGLGDIGRVRGACRLQVARPWQRAGARRSDRPHHQDDHDSPDAGHGGGATAYDAGPGTAPGLLGHAGRGYVDGVDGSRRFIVPPSPAVRAPTHAAGPAPRTSVV